MFCPPILFQALPCTTAFIEANAELQTDHCRGIILDKFPLNYESFDDRIASGKDFKKIRNYFQNKFY